MQRLRWTLVRLWGFLLVLCVSCDPSSFPVLNRAPGSPLTPSSSPTALAGAPSTPASAVFFPQLTPADGERAFPAALLSGRLALVEGCLRVNASEGDTSYLIIWPPEVRLQVTTDTLQILNASGQLLAQVGESVQLGGGELARTAPILRELRQPLSTACPGPYWLASEITK